MFNRDPMFGHIQETHHKGEAAIAQSLSPVKVGGTKAIIVKGRIEHSHIAHIKSKAGNRRASISMPVFNLIDKRSRIT